jgi:heterotetrameric sarcosine oxidase gamma subunit
VAEFKLTARQTLQGRAAVRPGCELRTMPQRAIASIASRGRDGNAKPLADALDAAHGLALPSPGQFSVNDALLIVWVGVNQWLAFADLQTTPSLHSELHSKLGDVADVTDQSDAWATVTVSGENACAVLERVCALDLSPALFPAGTAARTTMEHLNVIIAALETTPKFVLASPSSSAESFWHALATALDSVCGPSA